VLQSAAASISFVVTPASDAAEVAAPRTEWALKMVVSIPALASTALIHLATVDDETALCGLIMAIRSCVSPALRLGAVCFSYSCRVATGQSFEFSANFGKKNSRSGFDCRDCFASFPAWKVTPSGLKCLKRVSVL